MVSRVLPTLPYLPKFLHSQNVMHKACHLYFIQSRTRQTFLVLFSCFLTFSGFENPNLWTGLQTIDLAVHWWPPLNKKDVEHPNK
jgi:hypothetical protein